MTDERTHRIFFLAATLLVIVLGSNFGSARSQSAALIGPGKDRLAEWRSPVEPPIFVFSTPIVPKDDDIPVPTGTGSRSTLRRTSDSAARYMTTIGSGTLGSGSAAQSGGTVFLLRKALPDIAPAVFAASALVADLDTGEAYYAKDPDKRYPMASITKLVTAAQVLSIEDVSRTKTIMPSDFPSLDDSTYQVLRAGETYTLNDLVRAMLTISSNVAAQATAHYFGLESFLAAMNRTALDWGLINTYFADPTGLSVANQSTASDLRLLAQIIADEYPELFASTRKPDTVITDIATKTQRTLTNINLFAGDPQFIGGKTGYTDIAQENLLSVFDHRGRRVVIVILGSDNRFGETQALWEWFRTNFVPALSV